jgi:hypothetical protein
MDQDASTLHWHYWAADVLARLDPETGANGPAATEMMGGASCGRHMHQNATLSSPPCSWPGSGSGSGCAMFAMLMVHDVSQLLLSLAAWRAHMPTRPHIRSSARKYPVRRGHGLDVLR